MQADALIGSHGILPFHNFFDYAGDVLGPSKYRLLPSLLWIGPGDLLLHLVCGGGALLSVMLLVGAAPAPILFLLWLFYLSLCTAGQDFMQFQWDILLLETGFLAIFLAPPLQRNFRRSEPNTLALWMLRWLLFRLMFSSGVVKLLSGDPNWRNLNALRFHYETQPLPTWIGWYVHQLPAWFQTGSCVFMFVVEIAAPFLIFLPARVRRHAAWPLILLQVLILLTGNYCFFNWLAIILCLPLLDDSMFPSRRPPPQPLPEERPPLAARIWRRWITVPVLAFLFLYSLVQMAVTLRLHVPWPRAVAGIYNVVEPFRMVNRYGLFAVMTTERDEIIVEGSRDGTKWLPYEFKYKPGYVNRRPGFVAPYQPRLDWQMWFAALGTCQENQWFIFLCERLLAGDRSVLSLLAYNPFPDRPPEHIRARLYRYHFTDWPTHSATGRWWIREDLGDYCPALP